MTDSRYDVIIIGAGVVGLGVALEVARRFPGRRLLVLEKEARVATHQSGHNSGVIHSGVYYKPGSLKARLCVAGAAAMVNFCREHSIPHNICGKVIVATEQEEIPRLHELRKRGEANGLNGLRLIGPEQLREIEPHASGVRALVVPSTGITDYALVSGKYAELISRNGGTILTSAAATSIRRSSSEILVETPRGAFSANSLINCAGLYSDRISRMAGDEPGILIVPFRGEYYDLLPERASLVRSLIYPVPDPRFPFLGVHFTRRITGKVDAGPNAVLALAREGYRHADINLRDLAACLGFPGFWRMASSHWRNALGEWHRSLSKLAFVHALQRLVPKVQDNDLVPGGSGVRAQALKPDGTLVDDFQFVPSARVLHVLNVPSPAATASLSIGKTIVDTAAMTLGLS
jgi:(S)-2-hydroxyglutarate dehydrogenase